MKIAREILEQAAWCFIHIVYIIGFRNRFSVMVEWFYVFLAGQRGVRLIYRSIEQDLPSSQYNPKE